jgi:hypothetical protein
MEARTCEFYLSGFPIAQCGAEAVTVIITNFGMIRACKPCAERFATSVERLKAQRDMANTAAMADALLAEMGIKQ